MHKMEGINHWLDELKIKAPSGYAIALHIEFNAPKLLFQTYPVAWINHYEQMGFIMNDPTVHWGFSNIGHKRWSELTEFDTKGILKAAGKFGLNFGVTLSMDKQKKQTIASFARSDREFSDDEIVEIQEIIEMIHKEEVSAIKLTSKQKILLNELANGARIEEASKNLNVSMVTIKVQLTNIRMLLGTRTSAEAVQRASDLGLLK